MGETLKILHVEDDSHDAELARLALEADGIESKSVVVADKTQFTLALDSGDFDLILSDYALPSFDGLTALAITRERYPSIPFIFLSGIMGEERAIDSLKSGATDYVLKGQLSHLGQTVRRALKIQTDELTLRHAADLLRIENERFRILSNEFKTLLDAIPDKITLRSSDFNLIWANKRANDSMNRGEIADGQHCFESLHKKKDRCNHCPAVESFRTGEIGTITVTSLDKSIWEVRTIPVFDEGRVISVIEIARDVTEHRRLEDQYSQAQKLETVGTLASGIAHDFNNILMCISGYGQMLSRKLAADDPQRAYVNIILDAANRASKLTSELLHFSRKQPHEQKPVDLNLVIKNAEKFFSKVVSEDIEVILKLHPESLPVLADCHHLKQMLINLATNANDAMDKHRNGVYTISSEKVTLKEKETSCLPGDYALMTISDTGAGMELTTQQRLFEPFFTTKEIGKGTGLGLAAVYGIIKQHGGEISLTSGVNNGTTFRIYLPLITTKTQDINVADQEETFISGSETILLAEDDSLVRNMTKTILLNFGYTVIEAENGEDAVNLFLENQNHIDFLFFDLVMPKMNGLEACAKILTLRPGIKALIASGYLPEIQEIKDVFGKTIKDIFIIEKPYSPQTLLQKIRSVLDVVS